MLIFGLAPGAHGSNRTCRPFTGDASGKFMYPVLHRLGFASQPEASSRNDGLMLRGLWISAACPLRTAGQQTAPRRARQLCRIHPPRTGRAQKPQGRRSPGKFAFDAYLDAVRHQHVIVRKSAYRFAHAAEYAMPDGITLLASYHPSNQNTATGKLTVPMLEAVFARARLLA